MRIWATQERRARREAKLAAPDRADKAAAETLAAVSLEHHPYPLFTEVARDGKCPSCQGTQFRRPLATGGAALFGAGILAVADAAALVDCVTCGMRFRRG